MGTKSPGVLGRRLKNSTPCDDSTEHECCYCYLGCSLTSRLFSIVVVFFFWLRPQDQGATAIAVSIASYLGNAEMQLVDVVAKERLPQLTLAVLTGITRI